MDGSEHACSTLARKTQLGIFPKLCHLEVFDATKWQFRESGRWVLAAHVFQEDRTFDRETCKNPYSTQLAPPFNATKFTKGLHNHVQMQAFDECSSITKDSVIIGHVLILLMAEILHHLGCMKPYK